MAVVGAITSIFTGFQATAFGSWLTGSIGGKLLTSVALSALQSALTPRPGDGGIVTGATLTGATNPLGFILGTYATGGSFACPAMTHGKAGKTKNAYLTYVVVLSDVAGCAFRRMFIDKEAVEFGAAPLGDYGRPALGRFAGYLWIKTYDGSQTVADPMLLAKYGSYPERPWTADMIGRGLCYAIVTFRYNRELFTQPPPVRFEMDGIPLYDPRKDSTVGGSGAHRWANRATWEPSTNPMLHCYNVLRGITIDGIGRWGGEAEAEDLPTAAWFTAMNECDAAVTLAAGGTEAAWRAGLEVTVDRTPADVIEDLLRACSGQLAEVGGVWKPRVGGPGLPVWTMDDEDIVITHPQRFEPFPGLETRINAVQLRHPDPASAWETTPAPLVTDAAWEAEDGDRRLLAEVDLPAVPYALQVQRLGLAWAREERRFRRHNLTLPPDAMILEPLDALAWTSARSGYSAKTFEVGRIEEDLSTALQTVDLRERDSGDYAWTPADERPVTVTSGAAVVPDPAEVEDFALTADSVLDATGAARRPRLLLSWNGDEQDGVEAMEWEVRLAASGATVARGSTTQVGAGTLPVTEGILPGTAYEARMRPLGAFPSAWTGWETVTTPVTLLGSSDLAEGAATLRFGPDWAVLSPATVLTAAAPSSGLTASIMTGFFEPMRGGIYVVGVEATLTAAAPRHLRLRGGTGVKSQYADGAVMLLPGVTMSVVVSGKVPDFPGGFGTIRTECRVEAIGLLSGEDITITETTHQKTYWSR